MADWTLHYPAWLIADGEPDFKVGDVFDWFAVEFWSEKPLTKTSETERSATQADDYRIRVSGELVFLSKKAVVIDFGLMAIGNVDKLSPGVGLGDFAVGEISIGFPLCIDPIPHDVILKLGRQWRMNSISADLTPYGYHSQSWIWYLSRFNVRYSNVSTKCRPYGTPWIHRSCTQDYRPGLVRHTAPFGAYTMRIRNPARRAGFTSIVTSRLANGEAVSSVLIIGVLRLRRASLATAFEKSGAETSHWVT